MTWTWTLTESDGTAVDLLDVIQLPIDQTEILDLGPPPRAPAPPAYMPPEQPPRPRPGPARRAAWPVAIRAFCRR